MYNKYIFVLFSFFVFSSSVCAEHEATDKETIKALVEKVKKAEPSHRHLLMNELKIKLRSMHQETRRQVMLGLRRSFNGEQKMQGSTSAKKSNMRNQNMMSMTESKRMKQSTMDKKKLGGGRGGRRKQPVDSKLPKQNTSANKPTSMRGM